MPNSSPVFSQVTATRFHAEFVRCLERFPTARATRGLTEYDHFLALCFGQLTYRESLRDIVLCLKAKKHLQSHLGFRGRLTRTNLAYAGKHRDWRLFQAIAEVLMRRAARCYQAEPTDPDGPQVAFALDASLLGLSLNLFPWGYWARTRQAALKLHMLLSLKGNIPAWGAITAPDLTDRWLLDQITFQPGAFYIMDRGYLDFARLRRIDQAGAFFVIRCTQQVTFSRCTARAINPATTVRCDQTVRLKSNWSKQSYPRPLRRITAYDAEHKVFLILLTNNFNLKAEVIADLYRRRWQVESFFKWIKQHLRIRNFYGRTENAVRGQIWSALSVYLMVTIIKKELGLTKSLNEMLQVLSVSAFEQVTLTELFAEDKPNDSQPLIQNLLSF